MYSDVLGIRVGGGDLLKAATTMIKELRAEYHTSSGIAVVSEPRSMTGFPISGIEPLGAAVNLCSFFPYFLGF